MHGERRWSWWREKKNSSLLSTVDELRESSANLWHERESANDQTFNWNLSEVRDKCNWLNYHPPKHCHCVCCLFIHFLCQLQSQHSALATDTFHRFFSVRWNYPHRLRVSIVFHLFWRRLYVFTIIKMRGEKKMKVPLNRSQRSRSSGSSIMATDNKSTTTSTSTHPPRRLIFITFFTFIGGF